MYTAVERRTLVLASLSMAVALNVRADVNNTAEISINPRFSGGSGPYSQLVSLPGPVDAGGSTTGGFNSSGDATCHVDYGVIRLVGHATGSLTGVARGIFRDSVTITAPGVPTGTLGTLTFSVRVDGAVAAASGSSGSTWQLHADLGGGASELNRTAHIVSPEISSAGYSGDPFGNHTSNTVTFQFGFAMPLSVELSGNTDAGIGSSGPGSAAFGSPLALDWTGIHDVRVNGSPVPSFTVASSSGTDWAGDLTPPACDPDVNQDGNADQDDVSYFANLLAGGANPTGADPDFNHDGNADQGDLDALIDVIAGGACP